ncbi:MAG: hypothetical protein Q9P14_03695 [candidate division KSB1 bacterium]|nr:hypothetical protein [candidate division KSB1 bacterium]
MDCSTASAVPLLSVYTVGVMAPAELVRSMRALGTGCWLVSQA